MDEGFFWSRGLQPPCGRELASASLAHSLARINSLSRSTTRNRWPMQWRASIFRSLLDHLVSHSRHPTRYPDSSPFLLAPAVGSLSPVLLAAFRGSSSRRLRQPRPLRHSGSPKGKEEPAEARSRCTKRSGS